MASPRPRGRTQSGKSPQAFRTISEVAEELDVPQHVLRFWETRFAQVKPMKRNGGRRLYRPDHVSLLRGIKALLYDDGLTIKGVQKVLREQGVRAVVARGEAERAPVPGVAADAPERLAALRARLEAAAPGQGGAGPGAEIPGGETPLAAGKAEAPQPLPPERVRASIARLETILEKLERG